MQIQLKDVSPKVITATPAPTRTELVLSFREVNRLLKVLLSLEDQLWAMAQGAVVSQAVRDLWPEKTSRTYSALSRLASFVKYADSENPIDLAELGLCNYEDQNKKLQHFMEPGVPIESIYETGGDGSNPGQLQVALQKQFPANYLLKGLHTWNVPLAHTINHLPPDVHQDFLPKQAAGQA